MFQSLTIIRELVLSLAKVMLKHSVKLCPYRLCGSVAACLGVACVLYAVQNETECLKITLARLGTSSVMMVEDRNLYERYLCEL
jgi:hypothetical protein